MGARLINNNGQIVTKLKSGQDDVKIKYEQINGKFEPVYYDGYVLYNSLKSDRKAYIDLGHKYIKANSYELEFYYDNTSNGLFNKIILGTLEDWSSKRIYFGGRDVDGKLQMQIGNSYSAIDLSGIYKASIKSDNFRLYNNTGVQIYNIVNNFSGAESLYSLYLFALHNGTSGASWFSDTTIHSLKEYDQNNQLIYHYVPARRQSDNQLGMLDVINGVFYTNANSVGTFEI